jgi:predicted metal-binding membrane protein
MLAVQRAAVLWMLTLTTLVAVEELTWVGRRGRRLRWLSAAALVTAAGVVLAAGG